MKMRALFVVAVAALAIAGFCNIAVIATGNASWTNGALLVLDAGGLLGAGVALVRGGP